MAGIGRDQRQSKKDEAGQSLHLTLSLESAQAYFHFPGVVTIRRVRLAPIRAVRKRIFLLESH